MAKKPLRVQRAFLLRCRGMTQQEIADNLGVNQRTIGRWLEGRCADVRAVMRESWRTGA